MSGENPQTTMPPVPREPIIDKSGNMSMQWTRWIQQIQRILSFTGGVAWAIVNKASSRLDDIETRTHAMLQSVLGTGDRHITAAENAEITALDALDAGMVAKTGNAAYSARSIQGTPGEIAVSFGDGISGNPTAGLPDVISTPRKFGTETDHTLFEADGTPVFVGEAIGWKDIFFPMAPPKTTGAGNPTLVTWNGNIRGYAFAVGDAHDFDPQEFSHDGKEGSTAQWHIHFVSRTDVAFDRAVKFEIEFTQADRNGVYPAPTVESVEIVIPASTAALTHIAENIATFTTGLIASQMYVRLTRIAAAGTAPADDPVITGLHYHFEVDTVSSRDIFTK